MIKSCLKLFVSIVSFVQIFHGGNPEVEVQIVSTGQKEVDSTKNKKFEEMILVVSADDLSPILAEVNNCFLAAGKDLDKRLESIIIANAKFVKRGLAEHDPSIKQIIPYFILVNQNQEFFTVERLQLGKIGEARLAGKLSCGIGGHLNKSDLVGGGLFNLGLRELFEEVQISGFLTQEALGQLKHEFVGVVYDPRPSIGENGVAETVPVGLVHVGLCFKVLVQGAVTPKSEFKSGSFQSKKYLLANRDRLETWTAITVDKIFCEK